MYPKRRTVVAVKEHLNDSLTDQEDPYISGSYDDDNGDNGDEEDAAALPEQETAEVIISLADSIEPTVRKVRLIVITFRRSPVKNDNLQVEVERVYGKRLSIIRDRKTQWSSLHTMLERFLKIVNPVNEMLEEYNLISLMLTTEELDIVKSVVAALDPFKVTTNFTCSRKCNLASAEDIVRFTASKLEGNVDDLSGRLLERLIFTYNDRKNTTLVSLIKFFHNPDTSSSDWNYRMPGRGTIVRNAKSLHQ